MTSRNRRRALLALTAMSGLFAASSAQAVIAPGDYGPAILDTKPVGVTASRFDASWQRANLDASALPMMKALIKPALSMTQAEKIKYIQSVVTKNIRWQSDTTLWKQHDYWASAAETLNAGAGDGEDLAIVKLQALRALGINPNDIYLTMARDTVGGPLTVLSVRQGDNFVILPDTGAPFLARTRKLEFMPLISLGLRGAWIHMKQAAAPVKAAVRKVAASAQK